jgi:hypothetical protein
MVRWFNDSMRTLTLSLPLFNPIASCDSRQDEDGVVDCDPTRPLHQKSKSAIEGEPGHQPDLHPLLLHPTFLNPRWLDDSMRSILPSRTRWVRKGVKSLKPAHFKVMQACIEDAEHANGRATTRRPTLDHNMVYVAGKNLKLHPFYSYELGSQRCEKCETSLFQRDAGTY